MELSPTKDVPDDKSMGSDEMEAEIYAHIGVGQT